MKTDSIVEKNQKPLIANYLKNPEEARITDWAGVEGKNLDDPFHTSVTINDELQVPFQIGVHRAVGGLHDIPNPGDMLCASLASCFESTLRLIANRIGVPLLATDVQVTANADVRGTLMVDRNTPVGFQDMAVKVGLKVHDSVSKEVVGKLLKATEHSCVIYQTLKPGIPISITTNVLEG